MESTSFEQIYSQYGKEILRYIRLRIADEATAEDLTATVFVRLWKKCTSEVKISNPRALLYTIARGLIVDTYRQKKTVFIDEEMEETLRSDDRIEDELTEREEIRTVYEHLSHLTPNYREVLLLSYVQELSIAEIAHILQKKEGAVRVLIHRALTALKKRYD